MQRIVSASGKGQRSTHHDCLPTRMWLMCLLSSMLCCIIRSLLRMLEQKGA